MHADVEIKANDALTTFNLADLNIRMSFNRAAFYEGTLSNPTVTIDQELTLSGFLTGTNYTAFYNPHTLTGSLDTIISYNIELSGGDGYPILDTGWVSVGRLQLEVKDINACSNIWIHDNDPMNFPPTFASEKFNNLLYPCNEGTFTGDQSCFPAICNQPPVATDDYITTQEGVPVTHNLLTNDTDPDNNLNFGTLSLISSPPTSEVVVATGPGPGEITVTPTGFWNGNVTPFSYQVCDDLGSCHSAIVYVTVLDDPNTAVSDLLENKSLSIYPNITSDEVTVEFKEGWSDTKSINIKLYSLLGQMISEEEVNLSGNSHVYKTNLGTLPQGAYILSLSNETGTYSERIIKQ